MTSEIYKDFISEGYLITKLFSHKQLNEIKTSIENTVYKSHKLFEFKNVDINKYYLKNINDEIHKKIVSPKNRYLKFTNKQLINIKNNTKIRSILKNFWGHSNYKIKWIASTLHHPTIKNAYGYRLARPFTKFKKDVSGSHIDLHYGAELRSNLKNLVTIWCPIMGFSSNQTLRFAPRSHLINHPTDKFVNQKTFITPVFPEKYSNKFKFIRPRLKKGEVIIFHPNLLHGGSINYSKNLRISLDFRLFNLKEY